MTTAGRYEVQVLGLNTPVVTRHKTQYDAAVAADNLRGQYHADRVGLAIILIDRRNGAGEIGRWVGIPEAWNDGWATLAWAKAHNYQLPKLREANRRADPLIWERKKEQILHDRNPRRIPGS